MVGALMFLGCPFRMILRIAGGDFNAIVGLVGFVLGILIGILFIKKGFSKSKLIIIICIFSIFFGVFVGPFIIS